MTRLRNVAVILAGGTGTRIGLNIPKQLIKIAGKPIIEHTIAAMHQSPLVDEIVVMMAPGHLDEVRAIVKNGDYSKVTQILEGADTRNDTTVMSSAMFCCTMLCVRSSRRRSSRPTWKRSRHMRQSIPQFRLRTP